MIRENETLKPYSLNIQDHLMEALEYRNKLQGTRIQISIEEINKKNKKGKLLNTAECLTLIEDVSFSITTGLPLGLLIYDPEIELPKEKLKTPFTNRDRLDFLQSRDKGLFYQAVAHASMLVFYKGVRIADLEQELAKHHFKKIDIEKYLPHSITKELEPILKPVH